MNRTSLTNHATRNSFRKTINANWHNGTTSTSQSTIFHIHSDIVTSTYDFLLDGETANLLQALKNAKYSKHKGLKRIITADEYTEVTPFCYKLKIGVKLSDDKQNVKLNLYVLDAYGKGRLISGMSDLTKIRLKYITDKLHELEMIYKTL